MLSTLARNSGNALRTIRPLAGVRPSFVPVCRRTLTTDGAPPKRLSMSDIELPEVRSHGGGWGTVKGLVDQSNSKSVEEMWANRETMVSLLNPPQNTWSGRSIHVGGQEPLAQAYARLARIMSRNNVPRELFLTRRHEKKGVKRRRLASDRWRRRFAHEVRKKVQLAKEIRARGA